MKKPFIAIYTEIPRSGGLATAANSNPVTAALLVVFANRDAQTLEDVEGTRLNLESQGEGPHVREFDFLREIPDIWDLRAEATNRAEADRIIAERVPPETLNTQLSTECVSAIHQCLRLLAGHCDGARTLDGAGFNKMDAEFGHSLASAHALSPKQAVHGQKLIRKYHRQLPADLLQAALGKGTACPPSGGATVSDPARPDANEAPGTAPESPNPSDAPLAEDPVAALRKLLADKGVPQAKQDEIIADATAKAQPGAMVGPFQIPVEVECLRTPAQLINHKYTKLVKPGVYAPKSGHEVADNGCEEYYGDTYQNGVKPGPKKLAQFREILELTGTPKLYGQEGKGDEALVHVKLFDPTGSWTWFITEFDPAENTAFGLVNGHEAEVGYIDLNELANARGRLGIGIEIDMHFKPQTLAACRATLDARAN